MPNNHSESQLIKIWQYQLLDKGQLVTEGGEPITIVYPGRINDDRGPDFREAVVATSQGLRKGDIEIHVKSSHWREHGHHRDEAYNRVMLHVVMWHNAKMATSLQNGSQVPVLALDKYVRLTCGQWPSLAGSASTLPMPCSQVARRLSPGAVAEFLDSAGEERFLVKTDRFQADLVGNEASQTLYQGIMSALGYSKNKLLFLELAGALPLRVLESTAQDEISDEECLARQQALLLGTAGLLPSQRQNSHQDSGADDQWLGRLEGLWVSGHTTGVMSSGAWHQFKVRPGNSPVRRLVAMSYLLIRYRGGGLLEGLLSLLKEAPLNQAGHRLEQGLLVMADGYWANHFDLSPGRQIRSSRLLGRERAADIIVNVLLPFTLAWSRFTSQPELGKKAIDLYRLYPRLAMNSVERQMRSQLGLSHSLVSSARRQQGLIHIYNCLCSQGGCASCFLGG